MEDLVLKAEIDDRTTLYISTIDRQTYTEYVDDDILGGRDGYFVIRTRSCNGSKRMELLAKASSFAAASDLFDMIVQAGQHRR